jgi:transposase
MPEKRHEDLADLSVVGIDIGKDTFHLVGFDISGRRVLRLKIRRLAMPQVFEKLPRCVVGMEACLSAHFVSRTLRRLGFEPRIITSIYVKPFSKGQKNDYNDAEAIAEAALRPNLKSVAEKSQDQLDLQALHRVQSRLVSRRTATINQIRAFLIEQGLAGDQHESPVAGMGGALRLGQPVQCILSLDQLHRWPVAREEYPPFRAASEGRPEPC